MSLAWPRPLILDEDRYVHDWARKRLDLKPGVTGLWQMLGRSEIPFEEMVKLDYMYVTDWSLINDLKLALRTIPAVPSAVAHGQSRRRYSDHDPEMLLEQMRGLNARGVQVDVLPKRYDLLGPEVDVQALAGVPRWNLRPLRLSRSSRAVKRNADLLLSAVGLVFLAPVFALIAMLIRRGPRRRMLFREVRIHDSRRAFRSLWLDIGLVLRTASLVLRDGPAAL